jgi:menaquinone-9 beta-reductase
MQVPIIRKLELSAENGRLLRLELPLGGFGLSRYLLDFTLAELAKQAGVILKEQTRVNDVVFNGNDHTLITTSGSFSSRYTCAAFGKRSNLDLKWKRPFVIAAKNKLNNYIGVKYHVQCDLPADTIALHTFRQGYCGLVKVEGNKYNLCYLTTAANLQKSDNNIETLEHTILSKNPNLASFFRNCIKEGGPVTISQISFDRKSLFEQNILMGGDAAGMITPLCGNGMSMALHSSKIAFHQLDLLLRGRISVDTFEARYTKQWSKEFSGRLRMGRIVQKLSLNPGMMNLFIRTGKIFPGMVKQVIRKTHGKNF